MVNIFKILQKDSGDLNKWILNKLGNGPYTPYVILTFLLAECGEVADKVRALEGSRVNSSDITKDDLAKEIVDTVYNLMILANYYSIDLDKYWDKRLRGIKDKFR